jgi:hypothetical protein
MRLVTTEGATPSSRAAPEKLPVRDEQEGLDVQQCVHDS